MTHTGLWSAVLCILAFQFCGKIALASGEIYVRQPSSTDIADCSEGTLVERLHHGGNVQGFFSSLVIACVSRENQFANWVLISGTNCYSMNIELCQTHSAREIPSIVVDDNFWRTEGKTVPFKMQYQLIRWALGRNCARIKQPLTSKPLGYGSSTNHFAWHCKELNVGDGTAYEKTIQEHETDAIDPRRFILTKIETLSTVPLKPADTELFDEEFPTYFIVDSDLYTYNHAREVAKSMEVIGKDGGSNSLR